MGYAPLISKDSTWITSASANEIENVSGEVVTIHPQEYEGAIKNPLMGMAEKDFFVNTTDSASLEDQPLDYMPWATLMMTYIPWDHLEEQESDTIDKISDYLDQRWRGKDSNGEWHPYEEYNIKVIPRVYLRFPSSTSGNSGDFYGLAGDHWPADMRAGDFTSAQFDARLKRLVERLGELWDNDPRVAYVQMGIFGTWGEQHGTAKPVNIEQYFMDNFKNKKVQVRNHHTGQWTATNKFGHYNDSIGNLNIDSNWQTRPIGGEPGYDYTGQYIHGWNAYETHMDEDYINNTSNMIRYTHAIYLTWLGEYTYGSRWVPGNEAWGLNYYLANKAALDQGAETVQKQLGYRYVVSEFSYPRQINPDESFNVSFNVENKGSAPMYYNWPVQLSLKDPDTNEIIWSDTFKDLDIRDWQPGSGYTSYNNRKAGSWSEAVLEYSNPAEVHTVSGSFNLPADVPTDKDYMIQLAVLDPGGNVPSLRFSIENYKAGGYHPMGYIGVNKDPIETEIDPSYFDNPSVDVSLRYYISDEQVPDTSIKLESLQLSGPNLLLATNGNDYNLDNLTIIGVDSNGNPHNLNAATVNWSIASGQEYANLSGSQLGAVAAGTGSITASLHGVTSEPLTFEVSNDAGSIRGITLDYKGNPLSGVKVKINSPESSFSTITDTDGNFNVTGIFAGNQYTVVASKDAYEEVVFSGVSVTADDVIELNFTLNLETAGNFQDDFSEGSSLWSPNSSSGQRWVVEDGRYVQKTVSSSSTSHRFATTITDKIWDDAIYEVDLQYGGSGGTWGAFLFRKTNQSDTINNSGYMLNWHESGKIELLRGGSSRLTNLATVQRTTDWSTSHHVKIVNNGSNIKIYIDNEDVPIIDVNESSYSFGYAGLGVNGSVWGFDQVKISTDEE